MFFDRRGLAVTGGDAASLRAVDDFTEGFLGFEPRALTALAAADAAPDAPLVNAYAAMLHMFAETRGAATGARPYLERAGAAGGTARERLLTATVRAWVEDDIARALALGEQASLEHPRDLVQIKLAQYHLFNLGELEGLRRLGARARDANPDVPAAWGLLAFGQEQCHDLRGAEATARHALAQAPDEPWSQHALAHVLLTESRHAEARAFLDARKHRWSRLNSFMRTHLWWHLALVRIGQDDAAGVLDDFAEVWGIEPSYTQDQIGAVSLLARLELAGVDVGDHWQDVADRLVARVDDHVQPFLSMHYVYGLARAGRDEIEAMMAAVRDTAERSPPLTRRAWTEICVPACVGLRAHAERDMARAARHLTPVLPRLVEIGGSHAQRDLFVRIAADATRRMS